MRLCKGYTNKEKRKMKTCDSHVNEEVKFVILVIVTTISHLYFVLFITFVTFTVATLLFTHTLIQSRV